MSDEQNQCVHPEPGYDIPIVVGTAETPGTVDYVQLCQRYAQLIPQPASFSATGAVVVASTNAQVK